MKKKDIIIDDLVEKGSFGNFAKWTTKEKVHWIMNHYYCSRYIAKQVSCELW